MDRRTISLVLALAIIGVVIAWFTLGDGATRTPRPPTGGEATSEASDANRPGGSSHVAPAAADAEAADSATPPEETEAELTARLGPIDLEGTVRSTNGEPIAGARVTLLTADDALVFTEDLGQRFSGPFEAIAFFQRESRRAALEASRATTDDDGRYVFRGLRPGEVRVFCVHSDHLPSTDVRVTIDPTTRPARSDIELSPASAISGRVVDVAGRPVAGARIATERTEHARTRGLGRMIRYLDELASGVELAAADEATTGEDGSFRVPSLTPVAHDLRVTSDEHAPAIVRGVPAGTEDLVVRLGAGVAVRGRLRFESGDPAVGARWTLRAPRPDMRRMNPALLALADLDLEGRRSREGEVDDMGRFEIRGVEAGAFELLFADEDGRRLRETVHLAEVDVDLGDLDLSAPLALRGRVVTALGTGVDGARVWVPSNEHQWDSEPLIETTTGPDGRFELGPLETEDVRVLAEHERFGAAKANATAGEGEVELRFDDGRDLVGRVIDAETREGIPDARVQLSNEALQVVRTGPDGEFRFVRGLREDRPLHVFVRHPAYEQKGTTLEGGEPYVVTLEAAPGFTGRVVDADGRPVGGASVRLEAPGVPPLFISIEFPGQMTTRTADDGTFRLAGSTNVGMPVGFYLVARHATAGAGRVEVPRGGDPSEFAIVLAPLADLSGRVVDADGHAIARVEVEVFQPVSKPADGDMGANMMESLLPPPRGTVAYSDAEGRYAVTGLVAGPYSVRASGLGFADAKVEDVEVSTGSVLDIRLDPGASIVGRVVDEDGEPVARAHVSAAPEFEAEGAGRVGGPRSIDEARAAITASRGTSAVSDAGGRFTIPSLGEGKFTVLASAPGFVPAEAKAVRAGADDVELVLLPFARLDLRVSDAATGAPVTEFHILLEKARDADWTLWDGARDGRYEDDARSADGAASVAELTAGSWTLTVTNPGFAAARETLRIQPGEAVTKDLRLGQGARLSGVVVDAGTGEPHAGVRVALDGVRGGADAWPGAVTDETGRFAFERLSAGVATIRVQHPFLFIGRDVTVSVDLGVDPDAEVRVPVRLGGQVAGSIGDPDAPEPVSYELRLEPLTASGEIERDGRTPRLEVAWRGRFSWIGVEPGLYRVVAREWTPGSEVFVDGSSADGVSEDLIPVGTVEVRAGEMSSLELPTPH